MQGGSFQNLISQLRSIYTQLLQGGGGGLFVGLVVPPLIFEAMIHLRANDLKAVIKPSLALATVGVLIATSVGGFILWKGVGLSPYVSFLFAALIAPTDTVTVLEVFRRVKVPSKLSTLLDTEAAFNDATGIVIFSVILSTISLQKVAITQTIFSFGFNLGAGVLIGLGVAFLGELLSSLIEDKVAETILGSSRSVRFLRFSNGNRRLRTDSGCGGRVILWQLHNAIRNGTSIKRSRVNLLADSSILRQLNCVSQSSVSKQTLSHFRNQS
jgi:hypothetical protein